MKLAAFLFVFTIQLIVPKAYGQSKGYELKGQIEGRQEGYIYLSYQNQDGKAVSDSAKIVNQQFVFTVNIKEPTSAFLRGSSQLRSTDDPNFVTVFLAPNSMQVKLKQNEFKHILLSGSEMQSDADQLALSKQAVMVAFKPLQDQYTKANNALIQAKKDKKSQEEIDKLLQAASNLREQFEPYTTQLSKLDIDFIKNHPNSFLSAYLLRFQISSLKLSELDAFYQAFAPAVQQSIYGKNVALEISKLKKGSPGAQAALFTAIDVEGNELKLESYRGKYVLLDFWASWCVPCRKGNPHLKQLYAAYKAKGFEIIGISDDDSNVQAWREAIAKDQIGGWKHVLRGLKRVGNEFDRSKDLSENYGVHSLPTKILIDPSGRIIGRFVDGEEQDALMDKALAQVFGSKS